MSMTMQAVPLRSSNALVADATAHPDWQGQVRHELQRQWRRLQARLRSTWRPVSVVLLAPPHVLGDASAIDAGLDALDAWADGHEGVNLNVQLSSRWLLCSATPDASTAVQARELAQQQWAHYFGLEAEQLHADWLATGVMHGTSKSQVALVCAVPRALINGLKDVARERGLSLQAAMPWWAEDLQAAWDACLAESPAATQTEGASRQWAWAEPGLLTQAQACVRDGRWVLERVWVEVRSETSSEALMPSGTVPVLRAQLHPPEDLSIQAADALVWQLPEEGAA
jgi:hypothetical protein